MRVLHSYHWKAMRELEASESLPPRTTPTGKLPRHERRHRRQCCGSAGCGIYLSIYQMSKSAVLTDMCYKSTAQEGRPFRQT